MQSVKSILASKGWTLDAVDVGETISVELDTEVMMPLVIEKVGDQELSVSHYCRQNGDLLRDPELVFETDGEDWTLIRFVQDPSVELYDPEGIDVENFVKVWDRNLRRQGYVE